MASVRFLRNINIKVTFDNEDSMVPFSAGDIYTVTRIEVDAYGFNNIVMPDGSVMNGVASEVFEHMGRIPTVVIEQIDTVSENVEIEVVEEPIEIALLDGQMRSESEEYGDELFAATPK